MKYYDETDCHVHFSKVLDPNILKFADEEALKYSRYIFTESFKKQQYGYCTHCRRKFKAGGLKHNKEALCPYCKSSCTVKYAGPRYRNRMIDETYFVYYEKSIIDPRVITARGIYVVRDYVDKYKNVDTKYVEMARYVFEIGNSKMIHRYAYYSMADTMEHGRWDTGKSVFSLYGRYHMNSTNVTKSYNRNDLDNVVMNTPFQYSTWRSYSYEDMVRFFDLYSKYPCVEYLTKLGFDDIVNSKLVGGYTYRAINWRGKNLLQVLKLSKKDLNEIKAVKAEVDALFLKLYQISKKDGSNLSFPEIAEISDGDYFYHFKDLQYFLSLSSLRKVTQYIDKQLRSKEKHYYSRKQVLSDWKDYIADCVKLIMDLKDEHVLFPKNLHTAHQNTTKQITLKSNERLNSRIIERAKKLQKYCFEYEGMLIRPAGSYEELISEGQALNHCVASSYSERYANGEDIILFIRKISQPEKSYYTMQVRQGRIIQTRCKGNRDPKSMEDFEVIDFISVFTEKVLNKLNKKQERVKIMVPA